MNFIPGFTKFSNEHWKSIFLFLRNPLKCVRIPVTDNKDNVTETIYKLYGADGHLYTVNTYHTRSTSLVNGKYTDLFMKTHFFSILEYIKKYLNMSNTSVEEVNSKVIAILLKCGHKNNCKNTHSDSTSTTATQNKCICLPSTSKDSLRATNINKDSNDTRTGPHSNTQESYVDLTTHDQDVQITQIRLMLYLTQMLA